MAKDIKHSKTTSILGKSTELDGVLTLKGGVRIDGKFNGDLTSDSVIILGDSARVNATIHAESVISSGQVEGEILSARQVQFNLPGSFKGSVETRELTLEKGVYFDGPCKMIQDGS